ncbi:hypothetical protein FRUB_01322 [Fimbriiglobus ruber]|uniref:Uncharacterized protein n=1 Tax=Fimbriiglobus ruber TaxID=1908690 RepID=A0A225DUJ2_9BACT|nr:hypothetical protein FRUB_01322 [Fimbriiglobus ruber]
MRSSRECKASCRRTGRRGPGVNRQVCQRRGGNCPMFRRLPCRAGVETTDRGGRSQCTLGGSRGSTRLVGTGRRLARAAGEARGRPPLLAGRSESPARSGAGQGSLVHPCRTILRCVSSGARRRVKEITGPAPAFQRSGGAGRGFNGGCLSNRSHGHRLPPFPPDPHRTAQAGPGPPFAPARFTPYRHCVRPRLEAIFTSRSCAGV